MKGYKGFTICSGQASKLIAKRRIMKNVLTFQRLIGLEITNTVKLDFKELLNKEQIEFKELFTDYQLFYTINLLLNKELLPI